MSIITLCLRRITKFWSLIIIVFGLLIIVITLYNKPIDLNTISDFSRLFYNFFELTGFTLFASGIFSLLLQLPDWRNYFEDRLKSIVLEQSYLNSLDSESLSILQIKTLKSFFKSDDIDKEGSFLQYFQNNLSKFIKSPFRDDVHTDIIVKDSDKQGFWINDTISYYCRMLDHTVRILFKIDGTPTRLHKPGVTK